nr:hypothetical protein P5630_06425 [Bacillus subtilis]
MNISATSRSQAGFKRQWGEFSAYMTMLFSRLLMPFQKPFHDCPVLFIRRYRICEPRVDCPKGAPGNELSEEDIKEKLTLTVPQEKARRIITAVEKADIKEFLAHIE